MCKESCVIRLVSVIWLLALIASPLAAHSAQPNPVVLPADLLLHPDVGADATRTLSWVDAETLQVSPFYVDDVASIRALRWSPAGDLLAIMRIPPASGYFEVCLLTRAGVLQSCFEDRSTSHALRRNQHYMVTWSEDGRYVYFVSDYDLFHISDTDPEGTWAAKLVEAEVATGQTQRILYQTQPSNQFAPFRLYWTDDLHYLQAGYTIIDLWQATEIALPDNDPTLGRLGYCPQFSPQGNYLMARTALNDALSGWALVSPEGQITQTVGSDRLAQAQINWMECPIWQSDEAAFYFLGGVENEARLFQYTLASDTLVTVRQLYTYDPQNPFIEHFPRMPSRLAPDNATLAINFRGAGTSAAETRILTPTHEWVTVDGQEPFAEFSRNPIWIPPLRDSSTRPGESE